MPCNSDYMNPSEKEQQLQETAMLLTWLNYQLGIRSTDKMHMAAKNQYCRDDYVPELCKLVRSLTEEQMNTYVYNGRDRMSRKLADWWDEHEAADRKRVAKEEEARKRKEIIERVKEKLEPDELEALGLKKSTKRGRKS